MNRNHFRYAAFLVILIAACYAANFSFVFAGSISVSAIVNGVCGNGVLEFDEQCEGSDLGGQTCAGLGYTGGTLNCNVNCTFNTSACTSGGGRRGGVGFFSPVFLQPPLPPDGGFRIIINNNAQKTSSSLVTLGLIAGSDIKTMAISNFYDFRNAIQEPYQSSKSWYLCHGQTVCSKGNHTVYVKFYSPYGQTSATISASIVYQKETTGKEPEQVSLTPGLFNKNLRAGDVDKDVKVLQQYLNASGFILAKKGPGSPGNETNFFGPLTKAALIKFQEAHAKEILAPLGLTKGTGFFGPSTRNYINSLK